MSNRAPDRRALLLGGALGAGAMSGMSAAQAAGGASGAAPVFAPKAKPMPFDPAGVKGLSERLLRSHYDNNYMGAVRRLGAISAELAGLDMATAPGFRLNGLKREELIAWNSMALHDIYFAGLSPASGDAPGKPAAALGQAIERDFGGMDRWRAEFAAMGKALGGGSGWVLLTWSRRDGRLSNTWAADHTMTLADGAVLLALDMYEHAYQMDYGAKADAYVAAFMSAFSWTHANAVFADVAG